MKYWWVNQKQTYKQESKGGYMWSPKTRKDGGRLEYYDNMTRVVEGDIVFSYRDGEIASVGIIQSQGYSSPKPSEFGSAGDAWSAEGWCVDVEYHELSRPLRPKEHIDSIRPLLPAKYSPIQSDGNGNQVYLCAIPPDMGQHLVDLIGSEARSVATSIDESLRSQIEADQAESEIKADGSLHETEKNQLIRSRRGQGVFRSLLEKLEPRCRVTGVTELRHLVASHIKPWAVSSNKERLDGANGLLLAPHVDHLFDKGYISFTDNGELLISPDLSPDILKAWGIQCSVVSEFNDEQRLYLAYHRAKVFRSGDE